MFIKLWKKNDTGQQPYMKNHVHMVRSKLYFPNFDDLGFRFILFSSFFPHYKLPHARKHIIIDTQKYLEKMERERRRNIIFVSISTRTTSNNILIYFYRYPNQLMLQFNKKTCKFKLEGTTRWQKIKMVCD